GTRCSAGPAGARCAGNGARRHPGSGAALRRDGAAAEKATPGRRRTGAHPGLSGEIAMVPDYLTIAEAARLIEKKELSPVELTESRLARIDKLDGQLHSFIRVLPDQARAAA